MIIKPRQVRRSSKFTSRLKTGSRQRQEYAASVYSMAAIQAVLAVVMILAGIKGYQAVHVQAGHLSLPVKLALPLVFTAGALLSLRACIKNVRAVRQLSQLKRQPKE
jgi:hypothetical protein